jgi:hypothetical protein
MQGEWVKGVIDQLETDEATGQVRVVEHKTRRNGHLPSAAQQETARLQVCALCCCDGSSPLEVVLTANTKT